MNEIILFMGDREEGHGLVSTMVISANCTAEDLMRYYRRGVELIGFDLIHGSGIVHLPADLIQMLSEWSFPDINLIRESGGDLYKEDYFRLFLFFVKTGYNDINIDKEEVFTSSRMEQASNQVSIGGHALLDY